MSAAAQPVGLFVTCLVDLLRPSVAEAAARLLQAAGFRVRVPAQSCCGQPNLNGGDRDGARDLARRLVRGFADCIHVVAPSASCVATIRGCPELFDDDPAGRAAAEALAARTYELTQFLDRFVPDLPVPPGWAATVTYHDSCSALRGLGLREAPRRLLGHVDGLVLRELESPAECCGFGGLFCVDYPEISARIADEKIATVLATGADHIVGGDLGCLLHLEGRLQRRGLAVRAVHVAEVLAGVAPGTAGDGDA